MVGAEMDVDMELGSEEVDRRPCLLETSSYLIWFDLRKRPFHQKSTCLMRFTLGPFVVQIWAHDTSQNGPNETRVLHRVGCEHEP